MVTKFDKRKWTYTIATATLWMRGWREAEDLMITCQWEMYDKYKVDNQKIGLDVKPCVTWANNQQIHHNLWDIVSWHHANSSTREAFDLRYVFQDTALCNEQVHFEWDSSFVRPLSLLARSWLHWYTAESSIVNVKREERSGYPIKVQSYE